MLNKGVTMNSQLASKDWRRINDIILRMNYESDIFKALNSLLVEIDKVVPYEKASVYFYTLSKNGLSVDTKIGLGFDERDLELYDEYYCKIDDVVEKMLPTKLITVRSSDVFNLNERKKTEYFNDYIRPVQTHFSLDANFRWDKTSTETNFGSLNLFRSKNCPDFTDKELEICKILQPHIETKAYQYIFSFVNSLEDICDKFSFTRSEDEIAHLILKGYTNEQIANEQFITVSTVKKHVASILKKSRSDSRIEFICKIKFNQKDIAI